MNTSDEISLHQVLQIFTKRWKYLIVLALVFTLGALSKHKYFPSYPGSGKLIIKDVRNSQLQSIIGHAAGLGGDIPSPEFKGDDPVLRAVALLDIHEFFVSVTQRLLQLRSQHSIPALEHFLKAKNSDGMNSEYIHEVANRLSVLISFNASKADILEVNAKSNNRELTVLLVNETLLEAQNNLINRELDDLNRAEAYFRLEIDGVRGRLERIENSTVRKMQKNQIFSVDSEKGESSKYIGELKKNINDTRIALSNNESKIAELRNKINVSKISDSGVISKFNESSQVRLLEDENKELNLELKTYQSYLKNFENQKTGLVPFQYELEKMNASHEFEYKIYASLNDSLARIGLQKTYVKNKVEILELERNSRVHSSPPLLIMILLALTISQVFGIFSIYVYELFKPTVPTFKY
ncbi:MAG: hypothetical protein WC635_14625 [Bacteriovorax sp.]|jgi:capsular polysaccharide biosynthesis protein